MSNLSNLVEELESLADEWEDVASWGKREKMSDYQRGLKDADRQHARELREVLDDD